MSFISQPLWENFFNKNQSTIVDYLKNIPIFEGLSGNELNRLEKYMTIRKYMQNEPVFGESEPGAGMYIIINGEVKIILREVKSVKNLVMLKTGDFFGEMALLAESPRSAGALAASNKLELISFFRQDLARVQDEYPEISSKILWNIGKVLSNRLRESNRVIQELNKG